MKASDIVPGLLVYRVSPVHGHSDFVQEGPVTGITGDIVSVDVKKPTAADHCMFHVDELTATREEAVAIATRRDAAHENRIRKVEQDAAAAANLILAAMPALRLAQVDEQLSLALANAKLPGEILFAKLWGSRSHNTQQPDSDWDFSGVYMWPSRVVLGLSDEVRRDTATISKTGPDSDGDDVAFHEVGKFCQLLLKGNPHLIEMLFTDRMFRLSDDKVMESLWIELVRERRRFVSATVVRQYHEYARHQLHLLKRHGGARGLHTATGGYNTKWAYHMLRVLWDGERLAKGEDPVVWKDHGEQEWTDLMDIRAGLWSMDKVSAESEALIHRIDALKPWPLPERGDEEWLNDWLVRVRMVNIGRGK